LNGGWFVPTGLANQLARRQVGLMIDLATPDAMLDLTNKAVIADLIATVTRETGVTLHDETSTAEAITEGAATILSQGNVAIAALPPVGSAAFLAALTRIKKVIQGDDAAALRNVTAGAADVAQVALPSSRG